MGWCFISSEGEDVLKLDVEMHDPFFDFLYVLDSEVGWSNLDGIYFFCRASIMFAKSINIYWHAPWDEMANHLDQAISVCCIQIPNQLMSTFSLSHEMMENQLSLLHLVVEMSLTVPDYYLRLYMLYV